MSFGDLSDAEISQPLIAEKDQFDDTLPPPPLRTPNNQQSLSCCEKMRKYYKLILVVITLLSVVFLAFYKTQYDKLYKVLEVLEFFGNNVEASGSTFKCSSKGYLPWTPPSFQRINDGHFSYSAFCQPGLDSNDNECGMVVALSVVKKVKQSSDQFRCKLWYEGSSNSIEGIFSSTNYESPDDTKDLSLVQLNCENKFPGKLPYGMSIIGEKVNVYLPIEEAIPNEFHAPQDSVGVCLLPQKTPEDSTFQLAESIFFNSYFGAKNFFIYSNFVTHKFNQIVSLSEKEDHTLSVRIFPWNPPFEMNENFVRFFLQKDCLLRSRRIWQTKVILTPFQLLVPKYSSTVSSVLKYWEKPGAVKTQVLRFCKEFPADSHSSNNVFKIQALEQATYAQSLSLERLNLYFDLENPKSSQTEDVQEISAENLAIFDYSPCNTFDFKDKDSVTDLFLLNMRKKFEEKFGSHFNHMQV